MIQLQQFRRHAAERIALFWLESTWPYNAYPAEVGPATALKS
jgi:hypothetical protein